MKKLIILATSMIMLVAIATAETKPAQPATPAVTVTTPTVPDSFKLRFFKAQAQAQEAEAQLQQTPQWKDTQEKEQQFQMMIQELMAVCGQSFQPAFDDKGDPTCNKAHKPTGKLMPKH